MKSLFPRTKEGVFKNNKNITERPQNIKRYAVNNYCNDEVLRLCEKLCECHFESIKTMLKENDFYKDKIK